ncbi:hypothetical protein DSO57_1011012 [Entomophthora muscae]|uniref:Uncharacterized protein n=1 Tax=Entomophthora muscae TaxID=34485 RepID=A0ACC2S8E4_9FUNG|nr:hypothetical protein DSO57_1011012 [Entomophthora muscae]
MAIYLKHVNLGPKMLLTLGASCMLFLLISVYYAYKLATNLITSATQHQTSPEQKDTLLGNEKTKTPNLQVQNIIVNQTTTRVDMPVRIDNCSSLKTQARELESNPKPRSLWATWPVNCGTACLRSSGNEPPQADTKHIDPCSRKSQTKEIIAPNRGLITVPNGGTDLATISFMNLKSMPAANQEQTQKKGTGPRPSPMTLTPEQDNQAAKLRFLTNGRTPGLSVILLPLDPSSQSPQPWPSQCLDRPPMENVKFGGGTI